jgi:polyhydroxyalkanoate synthesis regulator phasin
MVLDGLRGYLQLANGLTDVTRDRARAVARTLLTQGEAGVDAVVPQPMREQVGSLADDLLATSRANRDLLVGLVRAEADRAVNRLGLAMRGELDAVIQQVRDLDDRVQELQREQRSARARAGSKKSAAKKSTAKKSAAEGATS